jgi:hypothetical protein
MSLIEDVDPEAAFYYKLLASSDISPEDLTALMRERQRQANIIRSEQLMAVSDVLSSYFRVLTAASAANVLRAIPVSTSGLTAITQQQTREFFVGATIEALTYMLTYQILYGDEWWDRINKADFTADIIMAGAQNAIGLSRARQAAATCLRAIEIEDLARFVNNPNAADFGVVVISCAIASVIEYAMQGSKAARLAPVLRSSPNRLVVALNRLGISLNRVSPELWLRTMGLNFNARSQHWRNSLNRLLETENGIRVFTDLMTPPGRFDISVLSARNLERLSDIANRFGASPELTRLLNRGLDANRMLIYLNRFGSIDAFETALTRMAQPDNVMFRNTITVHGRQMNLSHFMLNHADDAAIYYFRTTPGTLYFVKMIDNQGVEMAVTYTGETVIDVSGRIITYIAREFIREER